MRLTRFLFLCLLLNGSAYAQSASVDTTSLLHAFGKGHVTGRVRYYFMSTINDGALTDYFANAAGASVEYETAPFHHFQLGVGGSFVYNLWSSDLVSPDPGTGQINRYEIGLFDVQDPKNKVNMPRLQELYAKYNFKKGNITWGKQLLNTPFINLQDGRMTPTYEDGLYTHVYMKSAQVEGGILYGMAPRSTTHWFHIGESMGWYPQGVNTDGSKANYLNNTTSNFVGLAGYTQTLTPGLTARLWNQYIDNINNTAMLQLDADAIYSGKKNKLYAGIQLIRQDAVGNGGNDNPQKTYEPKGTGVWIIGGQAGMKNKTWDLSLSYTRITATGRYLMPREWGRDPFYTFMPRERNEGYGDVNAIVAKAVKKLAKDRLKLSLAAGCFSLPDVKNFALNKYGIPSYMQYNADLRYSFAKALKGFELQLLYVYKQELGNDYQNEKYVINKVNMSLINVIVDFKF